MILSLTEQVGTVRERMMHPCLLWKIRRQQQAFENHR